MRTRVGLHLAGVAIGICFSVGYSEAQTTCYVREDGHNTNCNGLGDAPASEGNPCAKRDIQKAIETCTTSGDTIKIRNDADGSLYYEAPIIYNPGITFEGYGPDPDNSKPRIGLADVFEGGWTYDSGWGTYKRSYSGEEILGAYIDFKGVFDYEHERMALVVYTDEADFRADVTDPSVSTSNPSAWPGPEADYYLGPGVYLDKTVSPYKLHIRLDESNEAIKYRNEILNLGFGSTTDPDWYRIIVTSSEYTIQVNASNTTIKHVEIEPGETTIHLCLGGPDPMSNFTLEDNTIWSGRWGALRSYCLTDEVLIKGNYFLGGLPSWVSWGDCKEEYGSDVGPCFETGRPTTIELSDNSGATDWTIERNLFKGGHDGIGTEGNENRIKIRYNVFSDFQDDPFEIEGLVIGRIDIYGNLIANSLNCLAAGQGSTTINGPIYFYSNICALARIPFVDRMTASLEDGGSTTCTPNTEQSPCSGTSCCQTSAWNGKRRYGAEHGFKFEQDDDTNSPKLNVHLYNNTVFVTDTNVNSGLHFITHDNKGTHQSEIFNNIFMKVNGRVGQGGNKPYPTDTDLKPTTVDWNLYRSMNNGTNYLADSSNTVGTGSTLCTSKTYECHGVGGTNYVGTDPEMHSERLTSLELEGFGCFNGACGGVDPNTSSRWKVKPGSEYWQAEMFILRSGSSDACDVGRGSLPSQFTTDGANKHVVDSNDTLDPEDIGAIPCDITGTQIAKWSEFPFTQVWKSSQLASAATPVATITTPSACPEVTTAVNSSLSFCGTKTDADGAPPYTYLWDFTGATCPADQNVLCPGSLTFGSAGTCTATLKVTDRWGKQGTSSECTITVEGGGGGSCSQCWRCICEEN